jgi:predicted metal-dependent HD superfamily phosphohydrolase
MCKMDLSDENWLRSHWIQLIHQAGGVSDRAEEIYQYVANAYGSAGRFYHTLNHIVDVLRIIEELSDLATDLYAVRFAVWFHDAVYESRAKDNEERSANFAAQALGRLALPALIEAVSRLIMATKDHIADNQDAGILLDADLAILGAAAGRYDEYARQIRQEYSWVPELDYRDGRTEVLSAFLKRKSIYFTGRMRERFEPLARANLGRELEALRRL